MKCNKVLRTSLFLVLYLIMSYNVFANHNYSYNTFGHIVVDVLVESKSANLVFDTGALGYLIITEEYADKHLNGVFTNGKKKIITNGWSKALIPCIIFKQSVVVYIGNRPIVYEEVLVVNSKYLKIESSDGIFSIPTENKDIWNINYQAKNLSINKEIKHIGYGYMAYINSSITLKYEIVNKHIIVKQFPLRLIINNTSVTTHFDFLLDTGFSRGVSFVRIEPNSVIKLAFDDKSTNSHLCIDNNEQKSWFNFVKDNGILGDYFWVEYTKSKIEWTYSGEIDFAVVGNDFLSRFNIDINTEKREIIFSKINSMLGFSQSNYNPKDIFAVEDIDRDAIVVMISPENILYSIGVRRGDKILSVNGKPLFGLNRDYFSRFNTLQRLEVKISRDGRKMTLVNFNN